jgi:UDP-N-acetylglucosamine 1-carboxyvinyltransferase
MIAALLTREDVVLTNCPKTIEMEIATELLRNVGASVKFKERKVIVNASRLRNYKVNELSRKNRLPILAIAPLLHRLGRAEVPFVGGDKLGARPVNFHISILRKMGASIRSTDNSYLAKARRLNGKRLILPYPSVGATETAILSAVLAKGKTTIENAAGEPEVIDLIACLQKMGALIELDVNRIIRIEGVSKLTGTEHRIIPDNMEVAAFAVLATATRGNILVEDAQVKHLITFLNALRKVGGEYKVEKKGVRFFRTGRLKPYSIETNPHPGFMTDWQQPFSVLLMLAHGRSTVHETVYEDRFGYIKQLVQLGANIKILRKCIGRKCRFAGKNQPHSIVINGPTRLKGSNLIVPDIRAGLAHLVAALTAHGTSVITGVEHLDRGYEKIDARLRKLGANIKRTSGDACLQAGRLAIKSKKS